MRCTSCCMLFPCVVYTHSQSPAPPPCPLFGVDYESIRLLVSFTVTHTLIYIYIYIQIHTSVYSLCERDKHALFPCMYNETLRRWAFESTNTRHSHRRTQPHRPAPRQTGRVWFSGSFTTSHNHGMTPLPLSERKVRLVLLKRCFYRSRGLLPFGNVSVKGEDTNGIFSRSKNASLYPARMPHGPCSVVSLTPHENRKWPCVSII